MNVRQLHTPPITLRECQDLLHNYRRPLPPMASVQDVVYVVFVSGALPLTTDARLLHRSLIPLAQSATARPYPIHGLNNRQQQGIYVCCLFQINYETHTSRHVLVVFQRTDMLMKMDMKVDILVRRRDLTKQHMNKSVRQEARSYGAHGGCRIHQHK